MTAAQSISTRPVTSEDGALLYRVFVSSREEEFGLLNWTPDRVAGLMMQQFELQTKGFGSMFPNAEHLIIQYGSEPVGRVLINESESEIRMVDIAILTPYRRKGIGRTIVEHLKRKAEQARKPLRHHVYRGELNAIRFYFALGYHVAVQEEAGFQMEWTPASLASRA